MVNKNIASFQDPDGKLEEMERILKNKLQKAKQLALTCHADATDIEINIQNIQMPAFSTTINYCDAYWRTFLQNEVSCGLIKQANEERLMLSTLVDEIEDLQDEHFRLNRLRNRKKNRRLATEIQKTFVCPYEKCLRYYGSDVSLNLHIKLKHNGGNKTDRQKLAQKICTAQQNGLSCPPLTLNLPPGYLKEYRKLYFQKQDDEHQNQNRQDHRVE